MDETPPPDSGEAPAGLAAGWVTLLASLVICMGGGFTLAARVLPPLAGFDMDEKISGIGTTIALLAAFCVLTVLLVYLSVVIWIVAARLFVPRETMYAIMTSGPTSRFDHWLFNLLCPQDEEA